MFYFKFNLCYNVKHEHAKYEYYCENCCNLEQKFILVTELGVTEVGVVAASDSAAELLALTGLHKNKHCESDAHKDYYYTQSEFH